MLAVALAFCAAANSASAAPTIKMPPRRIKKDPKVRLVKKAPRAAPPTPHTPRQGCKNHRSARDAAARERLHASTHARGPTSRAPQADWPFDADGKQVHPRSERGLLLKGLLKPLPKKGDVPDCLLVEPFTEEVVPANAAAVLAHLPSAGADAAYCYAKPPGDADVYKLHAADNRAPEALPTLTVEHDPDDLAKVKSAIDGDGEPPLYFNPKTGFEFEWVVPPPGFYSVKEGWAAAKTKAECVAAA